MKITVISGGSGNDALIKGLAEYGFDSSKLSTHDVKVVLSAYDNGKSTGVCRAITNTLGVSDIRKNHARMYKVSSSNIDQRLVEFYDGRYTLKVGNELNDVKNLLNGWGLTDLIKYAERFFSRDIASQYNFKDFSIANIVYSEMYSELGYEETNAYFCDLLGLQTDSVILNSFDNVNLIATTKSGHIIDDEGDLVEWNNADDPIVSTSYASYDGGTISNSINPKAIDAIKDCDLLVVSTGTFWSSIYPTLQYADLYKYVNESKAKKIWVMNNNEDLDAVGVSSLDFMKHMTTLGVDLNNFTIIMNTEAVPKLQLGTGTNIVKARLGNTGGKHNPHSYARAVLSSYYNLNDDYSKIILDFDDTVYARYGLLDVSKENLRLCSKLDALIVSGNTFSSMDTKLREVFGIKFTNCPDIWADTNSVLYHEGEVVDFISKHIMSVHDVSVITKLLTDLDIRYEITMINGNVFNIKVKPLSNSERKLLKMIFADRLKYSKAVLTGRTTLDFMSESNSKSNVLVDGSKYLYIGDEIDEGNDTEIAKMCAHSICVKGVHETNLILKLLVEKYV